MTTTDLRPTMAAPSPARVGQGTAVEQSRAVAEVEAAIVVALRYPRDITRAVAEMKRSCGQRSLAEKAFFRYSRGGQQISGPSIQLARELARCWGNIQDGLTELRRDDTYGQSEMQAWAWDVQTNTRSSTTFIVPHRRDTKNGAVQLTDQRDIYESNANNGARRLREMIFAVLPGWYVEDAVEACYETLQNDGDGTLPERVAKVVDLFGKLGITVIQIEQKLGAPKSRWTPYDLATLHVIYRSILRGETRKEDEFGASGPERVTPAEILGNGQPGTNGATKQEATAASAPAATDPAPASQPETRTAARKPLTKATLGALQRALRPLGPEADMLEAVSALAGRAVVTLDELRQDEADQLIATMDAALKAANGDTERAAEQVWAKVKGPRQDGPVVEDPPADLFSEDEQR